MAKSTDAADQGPDEAILPSRNAAQRSGSDEAFDRRMAVLRRFIWVALVPLLLVGAWTWRVEGSAVSSSVLRAVVLYSLVLVLLRLAGKRTLGEMSTFDLVILLLISEGVQPALVGDDYSLTNAALIVTTLVAVDAFLGVLKNKSPRLSRWVEDVPTVLIREGELLPTAMTRSRIDVEDVLEAARQNHGILSLDEVRFAILERSGGISIIPYASRGGDAPRPP